MTDEYYVIGLMSGTSMDGLDLAYVHFQYKHNQWNFEIISAETFGYNKSWLHDLNTARSLNEPELNKLDQKYGEYLGQTVQKFCAKHCIEKVDFVASHGHTIHHKPMEGITVQIGDGKVISNRIQIPVVYDFRTQDVQLGGQGAPLVPIGDELLFSEFDACLNLGGFSNISFHHQGKRVAFDIAPANIVLNQYVKKLGYTFDRDGEIARSGSLNLELLKQLNQLSFYSAPIPKSLGIEWVESCVYPLISLEENVDTVLRTLVEHSTYQISRVLDDYQVNSLLVTGGGAFNSFFMERLSKQASSKIIIPRHEVVEYKEALIFAFLGVLRWRNEINVLKSVTGAKKDHCSGRVTIPK